MTQMTMLPLFDDAELVGHRDTDIPASAGTTMSPGTKRSTRAAPKPAMPDRDVRRIPSFAAVPLDLPCQPKTFSEAIDMIEATGHLEPSALRHVKTDARVALKLVRRSGHDTLKDLPCDPLVLRPLLRCVLPTRHNIGQRRWSSIKASLSRCLKLTAWIAADFEAQSPASPEWSDVTNAVSPAPQLSVVAAFARYCSRERIAPADVTETTIEAYRVWRLAHTLDLNVGITISQLRCILNRTGRRVENWPIRTLAAPVDSRRVALTADELPAGFKADLEAYLERLRTPSPLDPVFSKPVAPLSLKDIEGSLRRSASILIRAGIEVNAIQDVVRPDNMKLVLMEGYNRLGGGQRWPRRMQTVAHWLRKAAKQWGELSPEELQRVDEMRKLIGNSPRRMAEKSRQRLAQFDEDPHLMQDFFGLPGKTFLAADRLYEEGRLISAARLHRTALSLAFLQAKPMRRENLAALELERHFLRRGHHKYGAIHIPGAETKAGVPLNADLPPKLVERIELHVARYRPLMEAPDSRFLFAWSDAKPLDPRTLAHHVTRLVERQIGIRFHVHLARHIAATLLLDADPGNIPVAQTVLGHADAKSTGTFYGAQATRGAQAKWMKILEERVGSRRSRSRTRVRPRKPKS